MRVAQVNLTQSDGATSNGALGETYETKGAMWLYVKASATITQYQACIVGDDGTCQPLTTTLATSPVATIVIPQFAFASGDYGWAPCGPFFLREDEVTTFKVNNGNSPSAKDVVLYSHATAGYVSDQTASSAIKITGLQFIATATSAGTAYACVAQRRMNVN